MELTYDPRVWSKGKIIHDDIDLHALFINQM